MIRNLTTASEVIDLLGGTAAVARLTGAAMQAVSNWRRADRFPADTYVIVAGELERRGHAAPLVLWSMREPQKSTL